METSQIWDSPNLLLFGIAAVAIFAAVAILINGWSMKLACRFCGVDDVGFGYSLLIAIAAGLAAAAASVAVTLGSSNPPAWMTWLMPMLATVIAIALLVRRSPFRAFGIYIVHSILSTIGTLIVVVPLAIAAVFMISESAREELRATARGSLDGASLRGRMMALAGQSPGEAAAALSPAETSPSSSADALDPRMQAAVAEQLEQALYGTTPNRGTQPAAPATTPLDAPRADEPRQPSLRSMLPDGIEHNPFVQ